MTAQQWIDQHPDQDSDYDFLLTRIRNGERVECVLKMNGKLTLAIASCIKTAWGELYEITATGNAHEVMVSTTGAGFKDECRECALVYATRDFLQDTRKMLEIAKNAAVFQAFTVPLNTQADVDALLALMKTTAN